MITQVTRAEQQLTQFNREKKEMYNRIEQELWHGLLQEGKAENTFCYDPASDTFYWTDIEEAQRHEKQNPWICHMRVDLEDRVMVTHVAHAFAQICWAHAYVYRKQKEVTKNG